MSRRLAIFGMLFLIYTTTNSNALYKTTAQVPDIFGENAPKWDTWARKQPFLAINRTIPWYFE